MSKKLARLRDELQAVLGEAVRALVLDRGELALEVAAADYPDVMVKLRDHENLHFEQMIDLCGLDYSTYGNREWKGRRFAVAVQLLSLKHNRRLRVKVFAEDDSFPLVPSIVSLWPAANWFEREAFDMLGIMFSGHPDLRRILTDYGFVGHPFRKDFPVTGYVEMRYDAEQRRVVYQPVTIEPRENAPRIVREANYGDTKHG